MANFALVLCPSAPPTRPTVRVPISDVRSPAVNQMLGRPAAGDLKSGSKAVWHWLYDHPDATSAQLKEAVVRISQETWDAYYAPVLGSKGCPILAIYSHLVAYPLYVTDYSLGHIISQQIEDHLSTSPDFGAEFERMARQGAILPDLWMQGATGQPLSARPLLDAAEKAVKGR